MAECTSADTFTYTSSALMVFNLQLYEELCNTFKDKMQYALQYTGVSSIIKL